MFGFNIEGGYQCFWGEPNFSDFSHEPNFGNGIEIQGLCLVPIFKNCFMFSKTMATKKIERTSLISSFFFFLFYEKHKEHRKH